MEHLPLEHRCRHFRRSFTRLNANEARRLRVMAAAAAAVVRRLYRVLRRPMDRSVVVVARQLPPRPSNFGLPRLRQLSLSLSLSRASREVFDIRGTK